MEKENKTVPPGENGAKSPVLLAVVGWSFAAFGGWHAASAAYDNFALAAMFSSPGFLLGLAGSTMPVDAPPLARFLVEHMRLVFVFYFFASLAVCAAGAGLLLRKAWALAAVKGLLYFGAACCLLLFLFPGLLVPRPYLFGGVALTPGFNAAVEHMRMHLRLLSALPGAAALWLAWRLEKPDVKIRSGLK